jgi:SPP1 gp7 family putative phage head morphogenesis protein
VANINPALRPSAALRTAYQTRLERQVDEMHRSLAYWVKAAYRERPPIAMDESPARFMSNVMGRLKRRWQKNFDDLAPKMADWFSKEAGDRVDSHLKKLLRDHGFTVRFKMTAMQNDAVQSAIAENVSLIKSIASEHLDRVEQLVMRSVADGRDVGALSRALQDQFGVTKRRAAFIARQQNASITSTFEKSRQLELGITEAVWRHSAGGKTPRPDHVHASGKKYDVAKGMYLDGVWTWPGKEINCRCYSTPVIGSIKNVG